MNLTTSSDALLLLLHAYICAHAHTNTPSLLLTLSHPLSLLLTLSLTHTHTGMEKKSNVMTPAERRVVAFHEAGHALTGWLLEHTDPIMKACDCLPSYPSHVHLVFMWAENEARDLVGMQLSCDSLLPT